MGLGRRAARGRDAVDVGDDDTRGVGPVRRPAGARRPGAEGRTAARRRGGPAPRRAEARSARCGVGGEPRPGPGAEIAAAADRRAAGRRPPERPGAVGRGVLGVGPVGERFRVGRRGLAGPAVGRDLGQRPLAARRRRLVASPGLLEPRRGKVGHAGTGPGRRPRPAADWRTTGPPATQPADDPGQAPDPDAFYVPGHYAPEGDRVVWKAGFWARSQPGWDWLPARWVRRPSGWDYREGSWVRDTDAAGPAPPSPARHTVARPAADGPRLPPAIVESEPAATGDGPAAPTPAATRSPAPGTRPGRATPQTPASTTVIVPTDRAVRVSVSRMRIRTGIPGRTGITGPCRRGRMCRSGSCRRSPGGFSNRVLP